MQSNGFRFTFVTLAVALDSLGGMAAENRTASQDGVAASASPTS